MSTAIDETKRNNAIKAEQIYEAHKAKFFNNELPDGTTIRRFKSKEAVADALIAGELFPEIWKEVAHHTLGTFQVIGLYSLLSFSSPRAEKKFKASFIACVENLLNI